MFRRILTTLVVSAALAASASSSTSQRPVQSTANMLVQTSWLAAHLSDKNLVILHVGADRASYNVGHIPGARFVALSDIVAPPNRVLNGLLPVNDLKATFARLGVGDHSRVVLYGDMSGLFAARAYFTLDYLGLGSNAALLDGGLEKWSREFGTTQTIPADVGAAVLTFHPHPELIIELAALRQIVPDKTLLLIDARPPADYSGMTPGDGLLRGGHIPGAKNVFWAEMLVSRENPVFKPMAEIRSKYRAAGLQPGDKVIVYCRAGIQAAHDYFTLKLAGFRPVLYIGSFVEWSNAAGTQVEVGTGG